MKSIMLIVLVSCAAWGAVIFNGAGFSHPDDMAAALAWNGDRPLTSATYRMNIAAGGGWMVVNLVLHVISSILLYMFSGSLAAACLFAAHPMAGDAVASVAGRSSLLFAVLALGACLALKNGKWVYCALAAGAAFFVRQDAVNLLVILPALAWISGMRRAAAIIGLAAPARARCQWSAYAWQADVAGAVPELVAAGMPSSPPPLGHAAAYAGAVFGYALPRMIAPVDLSADPDAKFDFALALSAMLAAAMLWRKYSIIGAVIAACALAPYALAPLTDVFLEHRAYLAIAGVMMAFGASLRRGAAIVFVCLFLVMANFRAAAYATPVSLWEDAAWKNPGALRPRVNLGAAYAAAGRDGEAEREFMAAHLMRPDMQMVRNNIMILRARRGDIAGASRILDE